MKRLPRPAIPILLAVALLSGCHRGEGSAPTANAPVSTLPAPAASPPPIQSVTPAFVDREWRVESSTAVAVGTLYTFKSDGTLVISSPGSTPLVGSWSKSGKGLVMVEDSISYQVDILALSASQFVIRSHNPGEPVDIELVPASS